jgi:hypothetical protein
MLTPKIIDVEAIDGYKIKLKYETGEIKLFDASPYSSGVWYNELNNEAFPKLKFWESDLEIRGFARL